MQVSPKRVCSIWVAGRDQRGISVVSRARATLHAGDRLLSGGERPGLTLLDLKDWMRRDMVKSVVDATAKVGLAACRCTRIENTPMLCRFGGWIQPCVGHVGSGMQTDLKNKHQPFTFELLNTDNSARPFSPPRDIKLQVPKLSSRIPPIT